MLFRSQQAVLPGEDVSVTDVTGQFGTLVLAGPMSRKVLEKVTTADLSNESFPWLTGRHMEVAGVGLRALRVSYVGELGWELHAPMADLPMVFDALMRAGDAFDIHLFGTYAMNSLRLEKAFRAMGSELTAEINMVEADMARFVGWNKETYTGKAATNSARQSGVKQKLVYLSVDADDTDCRGNEPVFYHGELVGVTTSGGYGHIVGKSLAFAYVASANAEPGTRLTVEILDGQCNAVVEAEPLWDPGAIRMRS